jgi:uncharacterized protein YcnI
VSRIALLATVVLLAQGGAAFAHVEVTPERAPAGDDARLTFEVPNERPEAATERIVIQMPAGVTSVEGLALRGWRLTARPATGNVRRVTLVAPQGSELTGDERGRFRMRVGLPRREGATLVFKVLQVYDSGEIVRWLGPEGTSEPAARLRLTAARAAAPEPAQAEPEETREPPQPAADSGDGDDGGGVPIWAGIGLILLAAVAGSSLARRRNRRRLERHG